MASPHLQGERDQLGRDADLQGRRRRPLCRPASSRSTSPTRWACRCYDPDATRRPDRRGRAIPCRGNGLIGGDPDAPDVVVAANGGSDLVYLPTRRQGARRADRRGAAPRRITSAASSSTTASAASPGRCRFARSPQGHGGDADPGHRDQFPHVLDIGCADPHHLRVSRSPTPGCSRAKACTAPSAAPTPGTSWAPSGPHFRARFSTTRRRRATPTSAIPSPQLLGLAPPGQGQTRRARPDRGDAEWRDANFPCRPCCAMQPDMAGHVTVVLTQTVGRYSLLRCSGVTPGRMNGLSPDAGKEHVASAGDANIAMHPKRLPLGCVRFAVLLT